MSREVVDYQHPNHVEPSEPRRLWFVLAYALLLVTGTLMVTVGAMAQSRDPYSGGFVAVGGGVAEFALAVVFFAIRRRK